MTPEVISPAEFLLALALVVIVSPFVAWAGWSLGVWADPRKQYRQPKPYKFWPDEWRDAA